MGFREGPLKPDNHFLKNLFVNVACFQFYILVMNKAVCVLLKCQAKLFTAASCILSWTQIGERKEVSFLQIILLNHLLPREKKNPLHYILGLTGLRNTWNSCLTSDLSGFTHGEAASEQPVVTLLYHKQDKSSGFLSWFARFIWKSMGRLIRKREWRTALSGTREGCSLRGCHITSLVIDYWLHYNESKQFCVILSQLCQILDNNGTRGPR